MSNYHRQYDVPLLDDIHNYFPALLYEPDLFDSVGDVLAYVRSQVQHRFDLFSAGQRTYVPLRRRILTTGAEQGPSSVSALAHTGVPALAHAGVSALAHLAPTTIIHRTPLQRQDGYRAVLSPSAAASLLGELERAIAPPPQITRTMISDLMAFLSNPPLTADQQRHVGPFVPPAFTDPVVVRPTPAEIDAGTTIIEVTGDGHVCAVCQDDIPAGTAARELDVCEHRFHTGCIDTWFERNVHCPVCRHDIRDGIDDL
jgi:hypothetical protein